MTMLDRMRRHRGWLKWSLGLVVVAMAVFFIPTDSLQPAGSSVGAAPNEVVADVDGHELTAGDFQQRYLSQIQAYRNQFGGNINDQLLRRSASSSRSDRWSTSRWRNRGGASRYPVSDEELAQQIFAIPGLQENGRFIGEEQYERLLISQNPPMTKRQFEDSLRRSMVIDKLRAALTDWMAVSDADLEREYRKRNEKVKLQVVALTADQFRSQVTFDQKSGAERFSISARITEGSTIAAALPEEE